MEEFGHKVVEEDNLKEKLCDPEVVPGLCDEAKNPHSHSIHHME